MILRTGRLHICHLPFSICHLRVRWLIFVAVVLVYLPSLQNGYIWDDDHYITNNATLRTPAGLLDIWLHPAATPQYYPLVHSGFWLEYHLWGLNPVGYHLDNVLLHAISCVLLYGILRRLRIPGALFTAALFAVHPVMVESVAWVTERKNVLSAVFTLAAAAFAIRAWNLDDNESPRLAGELARRSSVELREQRRASSPAKRGTYAVVVAFFIAAMLSKTVACTFPVIVLLMIYWRRGSVRLGEALSLLPLLIIGGALGLLTAWLEKTHVGASGAEWQLSIAQRVVLSGRIVWFYLAKLLWPWPVIFVYPRWTLRPGELLQWAGTIGVIVTMASLWLARRRLGRGPVVLAAIFVVTLLPALGFINVFPFRYSFVADHFQYLASVAVFIGIGWAGSHLPRRVGATLGAVSLAICATLTWHRQSAYANLETLWIDTLARNPSAWIASNNLAMIEFDQGRHTAAVEHFQQAAAVNPAAPGLQANLGAALLSLGRSAEAEVALTRAIVQDPTDVPAWRDLGVAATATHHDDLAQTALETAIRLDPQNSQSLADLAWLRVTSTTPGVRDPGAAILLSEQADARSSGYSIRAVEAKSLAEAALGRLKEAASDANRAASMSEAAGDMDHANQLRKRAEGYAPSQN